MTAKPDLHGRSNAKANKWADRAESALPFSISAFLGDLCAFAVNPLPHLWYLSHQTFRIQNPKSPRPLLNSKSKIQNSKSRALRVAILAEFPLSALTGGAVGREEK